MKKYLALDFVIVIFFCMFAHLYWATSHNTLLANNRWNVSKLLLQMTVNGADSFESTTHALSGNALHLDAWYGFHEIVSKSKYNFTKEEFELILTPESYIYAEFKRESDSFAAFRLSTSELYPSAFILAKSSGEFTTIQPIPLHLENDKSYHILLQYDKKKKSISLYVNQNLITSIPIDNGMGGSIGFRSGLNPTKISHIRLNDEHHKAIFIENFRYFDRKVFGIISLGGLLLLSSFTLLRFLFRHKGKYSKKVILVIQIVLLISGVIVFIYKTILSDRYPNIKGWFFAPLIQKEIDWKKLEISSRTKQFKELPKKNAYRILFIGSSQTWGAGATTVQNTFVSKVERYLNSDKELRQLLNSTNLSEVDHETLSKTVECINGGISAGKSLDLITAFKESWYDIVKPDLVIINLSNNDKGFPDLYKRNLKEFVQFIRSQTNIVFILEATSPEFSKEIDENHAVMREVATQFNIPIIDLHTYLLSRKNDGILWWDKIHMTDFAQELTGNFLSNQLKILLPEYLK